MSELKPTYIVFGCGSDIGKAITAKLIQDGCEVVGTYKHTYVAPRAGLTTSYCDLTSAFDVDGFLQSLPGRYYQGVINCAVPFYMDEDPRSDLIPDIQDNLCDALNSISILMAPYGTIVQILGQAIRNGGIKGAEKYVHALRQLHAWNMRFNNASAVSENLHAVSLLCGPVETREWEGLPQEKLDSYLTTVPKFLDPNDVARMVKMILDLPVPPVEMLWNPRYPLSTSITNAS